MSHIVRATRLRLGYEAAAECCTRRYDGIDPLRGTDRGRFMAAGRVRGFSIATKCATVEELIERYRDRVDDQSILVNTVDTRDVGTECAFAILLADKKVALAGTCTVLDVFTDANNRFQRPGMRLGIKRLGPESQRVFAELVKRRVPPRRLTTSVPVVRPAAVPMRASAPPPATRAAKSAEPVRHVARAPMVETRAAGSAYVLPANPLSNITDASLEGFVDCTLLEAQTIQPPATFPMGTRDELETVPPAAAPAGAPATSPLARPGASAASPLARPSASVLAIPSHVEPTRSEPLPLPPPPPVPRPTTPLPYAATELPTLDVGAANDRNRVNARIPLVPRRLRTRLLLAITLVPLLGAAAVVVYMQLLAPANVAAATMPATLASAELDSQTRATVEAPPPAPAVPARRQPIHAVLVKSYPIAARVTVGDRYFGTTPTYIKIPANTPVEVRIERRGFKPVTYPMVSKRRTDRVFVRLQRARARRR